MNDWEKYFFDICKVVASKSKDPSTKVGAVIVGKDNQILSTGYNGFCRGIKDDINEVPERYDKPAKYDFTEHSERNAIYNAARHGIKLDGSKIFVVGLSPCKDCARAIIQCGITEVYALIESKETYDRWCTNLNVSNEMFEESGVKLKIIKNF